MRDRLTLVYRQSHFRTTSDEAWVIVREAGAGSFVTAGDSGLVSAFAPAVVDDESQVMRLHLARSNPFIDAVGGGAEVVAIFVAASAYVSPSLYPSRREHPQVVPTWNYALAEVRGRARVVEDDQWLEDQVSDLTTVFETPRRPPWSTSETPTDYLERLRRAIIGIEITVSHIEGTRKMSQNRPAQDHETVRTDFAEGDSRERLAARWMTDHPSDDNADE